MFFYFRDIHFSSYIYYTIFNLLKQTNVRIMTLKGGNVCACFNFKVDENQSST